MPPQVELPADLLEPPVTPEKMREQYPDPLGIENREFSPPLKQGLMSNTEGAIDEVVIDLNLEASASDTQQPQNTTSHIRFSDTEISGGRSAAYELLFFRALLRGLPPETAVTVMLPPSSDPVVEDFISAVHSVENNPQLAARDIEFVSPFGERRLWTRDTFLISGDGKQLIVPRSAGGQREEMQRFADAMGLELVVCPFEFDGGNIRVSQRVLYVGGDTLRDNFEIMGKDPDMVSLQEVEILRQKMEDWFQLKVAVLGDNPEVKETQPMFHIDLCFTPLPNRTVAVADYQLTLELLDAHDPNWMKNIFRSMLLAEDVADEQIAEFSDDEHLHLFGFPTARPGEDIEAAFQKNALVRFLRESSEAFRAGSDADMYQLGAFIAKDIQSYLDAIVEQMERQGMTVIRVPYLPLPPKEYDPTQRLEEGSETEAFITYNNVLVEERGGEQRVYLPQFGSRRSVLRGDDGEVIGTADAFRVLDEAAKRAYEKAGLNVVQTESGFERLRLGGSLNCSTSEFRVPS